MRTTKTSCGTFPKLEALANYWDCHNIHEEEEEVISDWIRLKITGSIRERFAGHVGICIFVIGLIKLAGWR